MSRPPPIDPLSGAPAPRSGPLLVIFYLIYGRHRVASWTPEVWIRPAGLVKRIPQSTDFGIDLD
jgi:hypothetical protein